MSSTKGIVLGIVNAMRSLIYVDSIVDGVIHVWDRKFGTKLGELVPDDAIPGQIVDTIIWSQDQALMAIAYNKGAIRIFRVPAVLEST